MTRRATKVSRRVVTLLTGVGVALMGAIVPAITAYASGDPRHEPGLYLSVGQPTQLKRGKTQADGTLTMDNVGAASSISYNGLAAHLPTSSLYAVSNTDGALLRILNDGATEQVGSLGGASSAAAFGEGIYEDRMYYVLANGQRLAWTNVVTPTDAGSVTLDTKFEPIDMAWNDGYFWGLKGAGNNAKLTRMSLDGNVTTAPISALDTTKLGSGDFGAAWTYGNGNLGFVSNKGGSVQIDIVSTDPIQAEVIGYSSGPESNQLDAAMIPHQPGDVALSWELTWLGPGSPVKVIAVITNVGATPVSGYQLRFGPDTPDSRVVGAPPECVATAGAFQCGGGSLQPGEERRVTFDLPSVAGGLDASGQWTASIELNEIDTDVSNNSGSISPPFPGVVDVHTEVKARVVDENNDGLASPGEDISVYVLVDNTSTYDLHDVVVYLDHLFPDSQRLDGELAAGERRTVSFSYVVPEYGADFNVGVGSSVAARVSGGPIYTVSNTLLVVGDNAKPNEHRPPESESEPDPVAPPGESGNEESGNDSTADVDGAENDGAENDGAEADVSGNGTAGESSAGKDTADAGAEARSASDSDARAVGSGSAVSGSAISAGAESDQATQLVGEANALGAGDSASVQAGAAELSQTGAQHTTWLMAVVGLSLVLGLAIGGVGVRRARSR